VCGGGCAPAAPAPGGGGAAGRRAPRGKAAPPAPPPAPLGAAALAACRAAFAEDVARFSWARGSAPLLVRARRRAAALPPAFSRLLEGMLAWEPADRPTMLAALRSGAFDALRGEGAAPPHFNYCQYQGDDDLVDV